MPDIYIFFSKSPAAFEIIKGLEDVTTVVTSSLVSSDWN